MAYEFILTERVDGAAVITLNRPDKLNALSYPLVRELDDALTQYEKDADIKAMVADAQAASETMITGLAHAANGVNIVWGAGNLESTLCMSAEKLVIDDEIIGAIRRYVRGIDVNEETLALDLIKELGHQPDYLWSEHTLAHFQEEIRHSRLAVRCKREAWENQGSRAWDERAADRVQEILRQPEVAHITPEQDRELTRIVEHHVAAIRT